MRAAALVASLALVALTGACGANPPAPSAAYSPIASAPPADGGTHNAPRDIVAKLEAAGVACPDYKPIANPIGPLESGNCQDGNLVIAIFDSEGDVQAQVEFYRAVGEELDTGANVVAGRNWTVHTPDRAVLDLAWRTLGGRVVQ